MVFSDIPVGERVEVYRKFTDRARDFLPYGRMRAWSLAQGDDWGPTGSLRFFIRLGFDANNFYLYRVPLQDSPELPTRADWLPENLIDFVWGFSGLANEFYEPHKSAASLAPACQR